ncbi:MAG TPA: DUF4350 domain-containing protein [Candidatus Eremiobacteraceae bacterium]|nr:DUF4350 domain-containing protein [Candidatus Eremiobacteraceae bacterium]
MKRAFPVAEVVITALAVAILCAGAYFEGRQQQQAAKSYDTFSTYDAAGGGYEAWYDLLRAEGVRVERFEQRPAFLDPSVDVFVSAANYNDLVALGETGKDVELPTAGDWDALARWIRSGGNYVWLSDRSMFSDGSGASTPLTPEDVNVPTVAANGPAPDDAVVVARSALDEGVDSVSGTSKLRVPFALAPGAAPLIADTGSVVVTYPLGKGSVTVVTDESLFTNARIARADNARLAYDLATAGLGEHGTVAFDEWSHGYVAADSWWHVLPQPFQVALIAIAAGFVLLLVTTTFRFGPTVRIPDTSERTSAEYLASMARLYERGHAIGTAAGQIADAALRDVAATAGLSEAAPIRSIATHVANAWGADAGESVMELDRIRSLRYPHSIDLMRAAQISYALRKDITGYGRIGIGRRATFTRRAG